MPSLTSKTRNLTANLNPAAVSIEARDLNTSDTIGLAVGLTSATVALAAAGVAFMAWQFPQFRLSRWLCRKLGRQSPDVSSFLRTT